MPRDAVADYLRIAALPGENLSEVEEFLRRQAADPEDTLAVLERPDQPVALLKIHAGEATLFTFSPGGERGLVQEMYIGKIYDATITQSHAIENLAEPSAPRPERVEIAGSRLAGTIDLTDYAAADHAALMGALREIVPP